MNGANVGMVERGEDLRFALKSLETIRGLGKIIGQNFDGYVAAEAGVFGAVDFAHSAGAQRREYLIGTEFCAYRQGHLGFCVWRAKRESGKGYSGVAGFYKSKVEGQFGQAEWLSGIVWVVFGQRIWVRGAW